MNRSKYLLLLGIVLVSGACSAAVTTKNLRCEYLADPMGIDAGSPRLSWILASSHRGETQTAYQILVASSERLLKTDAGDLWDSGKVNSDESAQVTYSGCPLVSRQRCFWKVRAWDRDGRPGSWSPVAQWQMGLLQPADWKAKWIAPKVPAAIPTAPLVIRRATYEAVAEGKTADVTAALMKQVKQDHLRLVVNNKTLGVDPAYNVVKHLHVEYEFGGRSFTKEIAENQTLVLPEQSSALPYLRKSFDLKSRSFLR